MTRGCWNMSSKKDPRWNCSGETEHLMFSAGPPDEMWKAISELEKKYGTKPDDILWGGTKE